ncbi:hypothetical protein SH580_17710 [Coraliomargarita algicola]|uniref:Uncharacterized protein n=1 Tax=Coraliomargarita algicola TaxID=3092156 RepID=A0ABZ0RGM8_9BACT|nr:hypothetical protein [Coraliomargarita sp. J2-16]WPJ95261.1 hypothetical protein SH580_17710 [Coraliomargarita sp. J2-16]
MMDDFDTFKASREKMDPTTRKMSAHQWQQAYAAYRTARGRVAASGVQSEEQGDSSSKKKRRRSKVASNPGTVRGAHLPSNVSELGVLRHKVREQSAYTDLRLMIDILAWLAIGVVILAGVLTLLYYTSVPATLASLLGTTVQVIGIVVARWLVQVLIDIPDIALYRLHLGKGLGDASQPSPEPES